jgi:hypothetical protein
MDPKNNIRDFYQMYFQHYAGSTLSPATIWMLDNFKKMTRNFEKEVLNNPSPEPMATAPATGWVPVQFTNTKWHYFREGASFSACGAYYAGDVASQEEFFDGDHRSSDYCARCKANRLQYLSTAIQSI